MRQHLWSAWYRALQRPRESLLSSRSGGRSFLSWVGPHMGCSVHRNGEDLGPQGPLGQTRAERQTGAEHSGRLFLSWECWISHHHSSSNTIDGGKRKNDNHKGNNNQNYGAPRMCFMLCWTPYKYYPHPFKVAYKRGLLWLQRKEWATVITGSLIPLLSRWVRDFLNCREIQYSLHQWDHAQKT